MQIYLALWKTLNNDMWISLFPPETSLYILVLTLTDQRYWQPNLLLANLSRSQSLSFIWNKLVSGPRSNMQSPKNHTWNKLFCARNILSQKKPFWLKFLPTSCGELTSQTWPVQNNETRCSHRWELGVNQILFSFDL